MLVLLLAALIGLGAYTADKGSPKQVDQEQKERRNSRH